MDFLWTAVSIRLDPLYQPDLLSSREATDRFRDCQSDQGSVGVPGDVGPLGGVIALNLAVWLPALFVLGVVSVVACIVFAEGCARI
jgi:hypothetical protein